MRIHNECRRIGIFFRGQFAAVMSAIVIWTLISAGNALASYAVEPPDLDGFADTVRDQRALTSKRIKAAALILGYGFEPAIPEAMSLLGELLTHPVDDIRKLAAQALGNMRMPSKAGLGMLVDAASRDPSPAVVQVALEALVGVSRLARPEMQRQIIIPAVIAAISKGPAQVRKAALYGVWSAKLSSSPVIVALAEALQAEDTEVRAMAAWVMAQLRPPDIDVMAELIRLTNDPQPRVQQVAAIGLGGMRHESKRIVPILARLLHDPSAEVRETAAKTLGKFGIAATPEIPALRRALEDPDKYVRKEAAETLAWIEEAAELTESVLLSKIVSPDAEIRRKAISGFYWLARDTGLREREWPRKMVERSAASWLDGAVLEALMKAASDSNETVSAVAIGALGSFGPPSEDVIALMLIKLSDGSAPIRQNATTALKRFGPEARSAIPTLIKLLRRDEPNVRFAAHDLLRNMKLNLADVVPVLAAIVEEESGEVRLASIRELQRVAWRSEMAREVLENLKEEKPRQPVATPTSVGKRPAPSSKGEDIASLSDDELRKTLEDQLRRPRPDEFRQFASILDPIARAGRISAVEHVLLLHLNDPEPGVRMTSIESLNVLTGEQGEFAVPILSELVRLDQDADVRAASAWVLRKLGRGRPDVIAALTAAVTDSEASVRYSAASALVSFGADAASAMPALIGLSDDQTYYNCAEFGRSLTNVDPISAETMLTKRLRSQNRTARRNAICALGGFPGRDKAFRDRLENILIAGLEGKFGRGGEQIAAAHALARRDLQSDEVELATVSALEDIDHRVRQAVLSSLRQVGTQDDGILSAIKEVLNDSHPEVRAVAAGTLSRLRPFSAGIPIRAALDRELDPQTMEQFAGVLDSLEKY